MTVIKKASDLIGTLWKWKSEYSFIPSLGINIPKIFLIVELDGDYPIYVSHSGRFHYSSISWQEWEMQHDREKIF